MGDCTSQKEKYEVECPYIKANWLSKATFWWMNPLFKAGSKKTLAKDDLYDVIPTDEASVLTERLASTWKAEVEYAERDRKNPNLFKAVLSTFRNEVSLIGIFLFLSESLRILQPYLIGELIGYFQPESHLPSVAVYCIAVALGVSGLLKLLLYPWYFFRAQYLALRMKTAVGGLIYRKVLKIGTSSLHKTSSGQIVNYLSTDLETFTYAIESFHFAWAVPLEIMIIMVLIYRNVGLASLFILPVFVCIAPLQVFFGRLFGRLRLKIAARTDKRIHMMNEIIAGIRAIKIYCWEKPFGLLIAKLRRAEIRGYKESNVAFALNVSLFLIASHTLMVAVICGTLVLGLPFPAKSVFAILGWVECLKMTVFESLFSMIVCTMHLLSSSKRIQSFLVLEELAVNFNRNRNLNKKDSEAEFAVDIEQMTSVWGIQETSPPNENTEKSQLMTTEGDELAEMFSLKNINIKAKVGELIAIVGAVGSGKSSLLMALLGELPVKDGKVTVSGTLGYVSQQPWIVSGTVKDNIILGETFDEVKYQRVVKVCALEKDIALMKYGDQSLVGEKGLMLSGGQKARLTLARSVYRDADIYIMDDPLGAVDTEVGRHLFNKCICEYLGSKTRILVTHQLQYLQAVDKIIVMKEGNVISVGSYDELKNNCDDLSKVLVDLHTEKEEREVDQDEYNTNTLQTTTEKTEMEEEEDIETGNVSWKVYKDYISSGHPMITVPVLLLLAVVTKSSFIFGDWHLARWAEYQDVVIERHKRNRHMTDFTVPNMSSTVSFACIGGNNCQPFVTTFDDSSISPSVTSLNETAQGSSVYNEYIYTYIVSVGVYIITLIIMSMVFYTTLTIAGKHLHNKMFHKVIGAKTRFFDSNPVGRILNRFSRDVGLMDDQMPKVGYAVFEIIFRVLGLVIVTCVINPLLLLPLFPLVILILFTRNFAVQTTRRLKRIESVTKSPVYSHLSDTLQGLQTIRALHLKKKFIRDFDVHQNRHTIAAFLFLCSFRWFSIRSLFGVIVYFMFVIALSLILKDVLEITGGLYGLALTYVVLLADPFELCMRLSAEMETYMTSVERITAYTKLESETQKTTDSYPPQLWPKDGEIIFKNLCLRYTSESDTVLKDINCFIRGKEKIGIVGRTGAGKSSLLASLLRLAEPTGSILIDGVDILTIGLHELRSKISVIPQDPILFSGSLRQNLDPFEDYEDAQIWSSLDQVQLKPKIEGMPGQLYTEMSEGGKNFSVGQRQLVCLARAILHYNKILILDEATANVDHGTDRLIQNTIKERFQDCTVLTIAHRLHTIMDSHRVMVLDQGELKEFDVPYKLLQKADGYFKRLVHQTGKAQIQQLQSLALQSYQNMTQISEAPVEEI